MPVSPTFTFEELIKHIREHAGEDGMPSGSSAPNVISHLNGFVRERNYSPSQQVSSTLRTGFYKERDRHLDALRERQESKDYIRNRKSGLDIAHRALIHLDRAYAATQGVTSPFVAALQEITAAVSAKALTAAIGMPLATFKRWKSGKRPQKRSLHYATRIERHLGMPAGALSDLCPPSEFTEAADDPMAPPIEYRARLGRASKRRYAISADAATARFQAEWTDLVRFKTSALVANAGEGQRSCGRGWWKLHRSSGNSAKLNWTNSVHHGHSPTAAICFGIAARFIGWLQVSMKEGGRGMNPESAQTLAHLANRELVDDYIQWHIARADGMVTSSIIQLLIFASSLCHPVHGFLVARPALGQLVGVGEESQWREYCASSCRALNDARMQWKSELQKARDPFVPIAAILSLPAPLDGVADAVARMDSNNPRTGGKEEAAWARDKMLMLLTSSIPLRLRNLKELQYRPNNTGSLRQDESGAWRIVLPAAAFKNAKGAAKMRTFNMKLNENIWGFLELYLRQYRPQLAAPGNDRVFVSVKQPAGEWTSLSRHFASLTRRYFERCPGVGVHCMRHIVATHLIKTTGSFWAAAEVLNDREYTVRAYYGHLVSDDGAAWLASSAKSAFERMGGKGKPKSRTPKKPERPTKKPDDPPIKD